MRVVDAKVVEPIDFVLAIDMSKSMMETDLHPDRLAATKRAVNAFVASKQPRDRIGVVIFAQTYVVVVPLTQDASELQHAVSKLKIGDVPALGTGMGDGMALAIDQVKASSAQRREIILIADGDANWVEKFTVEDSTATAKSLGIKVHTVLVANEPIDAGWSSSNPKQLQNIAAGTGGTFSHASDDDTFDMALATIRGQSR
ncbi:MAG TPA: VWA domain-containing protein [Kofleriaceae bacterium]